MSQAVAEIVLLKSYCVHNSAALTGRDSYTAVIYLTRALHGYKGGTKEVHAREVSTRNALRSLFQ